MTKKRTSSSVVSIIEEDNIDLQDIDDESDLSSDDSVNYMNMEISTDNIEDIVTSKLMIKQISVIFIWLKVMKTPKLIWKCLKVLPLTILSDCI